MIKRLLNLSKAYCLERKFFSYRSMIVNSIFAGMMVGLGCVVYANCPNHYVVAFLFSFALISVIVRGYPLYTGRIGLVHNRETVFALPTILAGNAIGVGLFGYIFRFTRMDLTKVEAIVALKFNDSPLSIFILSVGCGVLMYLAVSGYKKQQNLLLISLPIMIFIISGFEHCIANMGYLALAGELNMRTFLYLLLMIAGNSVGSLLFKFEKIKA